MHLGSGRPGSLMHCYCQHTLPQLYWQAFAHGFSVGPSICPGSCVLCCLKAVQQATRFRLHACRGLANDMMFGRVSFLLPTMHTYPPCPEEDSRVAGVGCPCVANVCSTVKYYTNDHVALWHVTAGLGGVI